MYGNTSCNDVCSYSREEWTENKERPHSNAHSVPTCTKLSAAALTKPFSDALPTIHPSPSHHSQYSFNFLQFNNSVPKYNFLEWSYLLYMMC